MLSSQIPDSLKLMVKSLNLPTFSSPKLWNNAKFSPATILRYTIDVA